MRSKHIIIAVLIVFLLIIALQNAESVTMRFLFWTFSVSRIIIIPFFMFIGFIIGYITAKMEKRSEAAAKETPRESE